VFTETSLELIRIRISLNGSTELLGGKEIKILDIISVYRRWLSAGRTFGNGYKTVPGDSFRVFFRNF
jgi:hypothetical protein